MIFTLKINSISFKRCLVNWQRFPATTYFFSLDNTDWSATFFQLYQFSAKYFNSLSLGANAVWCISNKNRVAHFVTVAKSKKSSIVHLFHFWVSPNYICTARYKQGRSELTLIYLKMIVKKLSVEVSSLVNGRNWLILYFKLNFTHQDDRAWTARRGLCTNREQRRTGTRRIWRSPPPPWFLPSTSSRRSCRTCRSWNNKF